MTRNILEWNSIEDVDAVDAIVGGVLALVNAGQTESEFLRWCDSVESPWQLGRLDRSSRQIIFDSIAFEASSFERLNQMREPDTAAALPLWRYWIGAEYCAPHACLDGFVARHDAPVWESIYPPNGWMCGCSVTPMLESDLKWESNPKFSVSNEIMELCLSWLNEYPQRTYDLLR